MAVTQKRIEKNLLNIRRQIAESARVANRSPDEVSIVAVTKTVELDTIKNLLDAGLTDLGENRVQQLAERSGEVDAYLRRRRSELPHPVRWHMIGHLQRNKVKTTLGCSGIIHSVDSLRLAEEIDNRAEKMDKNVEVMLQVNCSQERQKFGVAVGAALHLGELIVSLPRLRLIGLMTMGRLTSNPEDSRNSFVRLRELFEEMEKEKIGAPHFRHLSMGMSNDYPIAVQEGATILRIGTALFE